MVMALACQSTWDVCVSQDLDSLVRHAISYSRDQLKKSVTALQDSVVYPRTTGPDGSWKSVKPGDWTAGFFPGCLWLASEMTGDTDLGTAARKWTAGLESQQWNTRTHDVGFVMMTSFGNELRRYPSEQCKQVMLQGARSLSTRFNPVVGCIKSWDNRKWLFPVIIDNMMNLELLFWASKNGGSREHYNQAVSHALKTTQNHVRADGGTYHVVSYDTTTGKVLARQTHQGFADESAWSRGQAWAIYGFTMAYRESGDERFLTTAQRVADYFIARLPEDSVPYWDFQAPHIPNEERDASAASIACSGLFELSSLTKDRTLATRYRSTAKNILASLCGPPYLSEGTPSMGILNHATGSRPANSEVDVSLIYGDYYFLEAISRYQRDSIGH